MKLEDFQRWKIEPLKDFLRQRGLKCTGSKSELAALCYGAECLNVPIKPTAVDDRQSKADAYRQLLCRPEGQLPDPLTEMKSGWMGEADGGMVRWPPTMLLEIQEFLLRIKGQEGLGRRMLSDYKEGKAYSYFQSNFLKEVMYHPHKTASPYCFLRSECTPSQNVNNTPHKVWILIEKETGKVLSAYCTCFAGLASTCNHVAAILFKVEHAWRMGWTKRACTSQPCGWNQYGAKGLVEKAKRISDMKWRKPHYKKLDKENIINPVARQLFEPTCEGPLPSFPHILGAMFPSCSNACAFEYLHMESEQVPQYPPSADFNIGETMEVETSETVPPTLLDVASTYKSAQHFLENLPQYSATQVDILEKETRGQSSNLSWKAQRLGRITGSVIHQVFTKVTTLRSPMCGRSKDTTPLVDTIIGKGPVLDSIPAIKYGRQTESEAVASYVKVLQKLGHKNVKVSDSGLVCLRDKVYVGASPDGLVSCECCGSGVLEVKCPLSIAHGSPQDFKLDYVRYNEQDVGKLKVNHTYFSQIQTQMGVTARQWGDFFVYTRHGHYLERIVFDKERWAVLLEAADYFFKSHVVRRFYHQEGSPVRQPYVHQSLVNLPTAQTSYFQYPLTEAISKGKRTVKRKAKAAMPIFMCGICNVECKYEYDISCDEDNSIGCDHCRKWYHWGCVGYDGHKVDSWYCSQCQ